MCKLPILTAVLVLSGCVSEYGVSPDGHPNGEPGDGAAGLQDTGDTGQPGRPVAVCEVNPNPLTPPFAEATWDGSGSYDPNGGSIISWTWTLVAQPPGSGLHIIGAGPVRSDFMPRYAGTYTGQLVVTNDAGVDSHPCTVDLEAVPAQDLWVEMYWSHAGDDMDLHLLAPGHGSPTYYTTDWDCYYANCATGADLDWGAPGPDNNPVLDLDDVPGTGPENINIDLPEDGTYTVMVHDFPSRIYDGPNDVTVNVYLDGGRVWTDTRTVSGENTYTRFAKIDYAKRAVTGL